MLTVKSPTSTGVSEAQRVEQRPSRIFHRPWRVRRLPQRREIDRFTSILACMGPGPVQDHVVTWSIRMARAHNADLQVVQCIPVPRVEPASVPETGGPAPEAELESARQSLQFAVRSAQEHEMPGPPEATGSIDARIETGNVVQAIDRDVENLAADLLVLAAEPLLLSGSRFAQVLRAGLRHRGLCFLITRPDTTGKLERITICAESARTIAPAMWHAKRLCDIHGSAIRILHPYHFSWLDFESGSWIGPPGAATEALLQQRVEDEFRQHVPPGVVDFGRVELVCRQVANWSRLGGLVKAVSQEETDLLIMPMSHYVFFEVVRQGEQILEVASAARMPILILRE